MVERMLIEERRKQCQIEVTLYSQSIEGLERLRPLQQPTLSLLGTRVTASIKKAFCKAFQAELNMSGETDGQVDPCAVPKTDKGIGEEIDDEDSDEGMHEGTDDDHEVHNVIFIFQ
ncbi:uncharacterized protein F5147DRAFT_763205 [Suillus discolor]|uniref:Uncharacterized protein n=1 Tax=Suillus discolor TaxID=1912936 RepID=A0A9P7JQF9_9AGAM|nr:uncharacterized protein F5147DRAFT_763205 [Suillus discolor]KAG2098752.1 hypothetical protein F5147DRAFT_763205 [Suillus discolor]